MAARSKVIDTIALLVIGIAVCWLFLFELRDGSLLLLNLLRGTDMAEFIRKGAGLVDGTWPRGQAYFQAPLYSYLLAGAAYLGLTLFDFLLVQGVMYAGSAVLAMSIARSFAGRAAGWIAGILMLAYGGGLFYVAAAHSTITELFLATVFLALWCSWHRKVEKLEGGVLLSVCLGVSLALLCLVRPNFLALGPVLALYYAWRGIRVQALRFILIRGGVVAVACLVIFAPVILHNNRASDSFVLLNTNGSATFRNSNAEGAEVLNYRDMRTPLMPVSSFRFWRHQAKKAIYFWWSAECPQNVNYYLMQDKSTVLQLLALPFGVLVGLAFAGTLLCQHRNRLFPCVAMLVVYYFTVVFFNIVARYRIPLLPMLLVMAGIGGVELLRQFHSRRVKLIGLAAVLLCVATLPWSRVDDRPEDYRNAATCAALMGDIAGMMTNGVRYIMLHDGLSPSQKSLMIHQMFHHRGRYLASPLNSFRRIGSFEVNPQKYDINRSLLELGREL